MTCDGYLDPLILVFLIYYSYCVMDISDILIIYVIVIMRIYSKFYIYLISITESIHWNSEYEYFSSEISFFFENTVFLRVLK